MRNNLLTHDFIYDKRIRFSDIIDTYNADKANKYARSLTKITDAHIYPSPFQKMSCSIALQVFSHSMAAAIKTAVETQAINSETAINTANFIDLLDKGFDCLNSKFQFDKNPFRCAISSKSESVKQTLISIQNILKKIFKIGKGGNGQVKRPPCFDGFVWSINSILMLYEEELKNGTEFLLTSRLNQDPLENFFSVIRQKGGFNLNPTARAFRTSFRSCTINNLVKPPSSSNCELDFDSTLYINEPRVDNLSLDEQLNKSIDKHKENDSLNELLEGENSNFGSSISSVSSFSDSLTILETVESEEEVVPSISENSDFVKRKSCSFEDCAIATYAGYLCKKTIDKFKCKKCKTGLLIAKGSLNNPEQLLILNKLYGNVSADSSGLRVPNSRIERFTKICLKQFYKLFNKNSAKTG